MNFSSIHPTEAKLFNRFAKIGVYPGAPWPPIGINLDLYEAIAQGVWEGNAAVVSEYDRQASNKISGWTYTCGIKPPLAGDRHVMQYRYLARAGMAHSTFEWPNSKEEAFYMQAQEDNHGASLVGGENYTMTWSADDIPKVDAYWSLTTYVRR